MDYRVSLHANRIHLSCLMNYDISLRFFELWWAVILHDLPSAQSEPARHTQPQTPQPTSMLEERQMQNANIQNMLHEFKWYIMILNVSRQHPGIWSKGLNFTRCTSRSPERRLLAARLSLQCDDSCFTILCKWYQKLRKSWCVVGVPLKALLQSQRAAIDFAVALKTLVALNVSSSSKTHLLVVSARPLC